ncbi:MAG: hypothetical protein K2X78_02325 [Burkholderiaceae bacterium]|nr:hypothetical protein [Burkholderiaceae bacterium]
MNLTQNQSLTRAALNDFIIAHLAGSARALSLDELHRDVYPGKPLTTASLVALRKRLNYLALDGRVIFERQGNARLCSAPTEAQRKAQAQADRAAAQANRVALPRRVNVMQGTYTPPCGPALRPGSLDFRACPSVGFRC